MPRRKDETYHAYKDRIIDPIGPTFCAAKWYNATIWLGQGKTASCHHPSPHHINLDEIATNPSAIHNTSNKKAFRKMMLEGQRPEECSYCWKVEDMGRDSISDRVFKTVIYNDDDIANAATMDWDADVLPKALEIAFDRTCNFACSYCNPTYSTTWTKDIKNNGIYEGLVSSHKQAFEHDGTWADPFKERDRNPYIAAFWKWWPELSKGLQELRITGGEPLMAEDVWKIFEMFETQDLSHMRLAINTNLGAKQALIDRLIQHSHNVPKLDIYTSCEAVGKQAEYIRDGLDYEQWKVNVERLLKEGNISRLHCMMTINSLCLFSITDLMDQIIEWKYRYERVTSSIGMTFNILHYPSFMSPLLLPQHLKDLVRNKLINWQQANIREPAFEMHERESLQRLIDYLEVVNAPEYSEFDRKTNEQDFKNFFKQYDKRRNLSIEVFPQQFLDWFNSIKTSTIIPIAQVVG